MKIEIKATRREFESIVNLLSVAGIPASVEKKKEGPFSSDFYCLDNDMVVVVEVDPRFSIQTFGVLIKHSATLKNICGMVKNMFFLGKNMLESFCHDMEAVCKSYKENQDKKDN